MKLLGLAITIGLTLLIRPSLAERVDAHVAPAPVELATVLNFGGSDKLLVVNDIGVTYRVQYIGVQGPFRSSAMAAGAGAFHGSLVLGQRVLLESDGKDEEIGYKLRHAYLDGSPVPLGAVVLAAGWATTIPYALEHRHRALYFQAQEQGMVAQANLRQPGILGPAAVWRPAGSTEAGYVAADPELHPFMDLLYTVPTGQAILDRLVRTAPTVLRSDLLRGAAGVHVPRGYYIEIDRQLGASDPRVWAVVIAHEGTHAIDRATEGLELNNFGCFEREQRAFGIEAQVWSEFFGPNGKPNPTDDWDRTQNSLLRYAQSGNLGTFVRQSPEYRRQCSAEVLPGG